MTTAKLKFLRIAIIAYIIIAAILWCLSFREIFSPAITDEGDMARASNLANTIYYLAVWLLAVIIVVRARLNTGNLIFATLIVGNSISPVISVIFDGLAYNIAGTIHNMLFFCLLFKTFQYFPKPVTREDICHKLHWKPLRYIMLLAHHKRSWFIFPLIALGMMLTPFQMVLFIIVLLVAMTYLYINLSTSKSERNKVLWLFWGIDIYFVCVILDILFSTFSNDDVQFITGILSIIEVASLLLALTMSFFFFDTFDTGFIVKRTILNSFMLICIIFVYNVIEHYFLHWISHRLHLSDALVSSVLSGILVMVFSPMHHKLMHFFEKRLKAGTSHKSQ